MTDWPNENPANGNSWNINEYSEEDLGIITLLSFITGIPGYEKKHFYDNEVKRGASASATALRNRSGNNNANTHSSGHFSKSAFDYYRNFVAKTGARMNARRELLARLKKPLEDLGVWSNPPPCLLPALQAAYPNEGNFQAQPNTESVAQDHKVTLLDRAMLRHFENSFNAGIEARYSGAYLVVRPSTNTGRGDANGQQAAIRVPDHYNVSLLNIRRVGTPGADLHQTPSFRYYVHDRRNPNLPIKYAGSVGVSAMSRSLIMLGLKDQADSVVSIHAPYEADDTLMDKKITGFFGVVDVETTTGDFVSTLAYLARVTRTDELEAHEIAEAIRKLETTPGVYTKDQLLKLLCEETAPTQTTAQHNANLQELEKLQHTSHYWTTYPIQTTAS